MQKTTKALIAVGAATVLMLGGGGSLAFWQQSVNTSATTFQTGYMTFDSLERSWSVNGVVVEDLANVRIVPGDVIVYAEKIGVEAEGDNLHLAADVTLGGIRAVHFEDESRDKTDAIAAAFDVTYTLVGSNGATVLKSTGDDEYEVLLDTTIGDLDLTITLTWPFDGSDSADTMDALTTLDQTGITIRQVALP